MLSYSQAESGRELTQPSPRLLAEPCTGSSKKVPAKFSDTCSARACGLCIGCPKFVGSMNAGNSNVQESFCSTLYVCDEETKHLSWPMDTWMWFDAFYAPMNVGSVVWQTNICRPMFLHLLTLDFPEVEGKAFKRNAQYSP